MRRQPNFVGALFLVALAVLWQVGAGAIDSPNFPTFLQVVDALAKNGPAPATELGHTLARASVGFAIALLTMVPLGIVLGRLRAIGGIPPASAVWTRWG